MHALVGGCHNLPQKHGTVVLAHRVSCTLVADDDRNLILYGF